MSEPHRIESSCDTTASFFFSTIACHTLTSYIVCSRGRITFVFTLCNQKRYLNCVLKRVIQEINEINELGEAKGITVFRFYMYHEAWDVLIVFIDVINIIF